MAAPLPLLRSSAELSTWINQSPAAIQLVPTMGGLHAAHGGLFRGARRFGGRVLVSVFVNPLQFAPGEDFDRYPRSLDQDLALAAAAGADALWAPQLEDIYPAGPEGLTQVQPAPALGAQLCGPWRPGHFQGVCTVVARLLALVRPQRILLGEKDWQQLQVLRRMVADLGLPVEIVACPTQREADGLPFSSRNSYLSPLERQRAQALPEALALAAAAARAGVQDGPKLQQLALAHLKARGLQVEYLELVQPHSLQPLPRLERAGLLAAAVRCGTTRLIDHLTLMPRSPIVAIDGPAGAGKSTVTRLVARQLGLVYLDTGAMYRAVTWLVQHQGLAAEESPELAALLGQLDLWLEAQAEGDQRVLLNGQDVTAVIRTATVTAGVSAVAALPSVRAALTAQQQRFGSSGGLVAEGRDIGTAVFPQAELKVFLTATVAERARRRAADLAARGLPVPALLQLEQEIAERDGRDSSRAVAPLCRAEDALELVSDGLTIDGVVERIVAWFHERVPLEAMASLRATAVDPAAGPAGAEAS